MCLLFPRDPVTICFCPQYWDLEFYIIPFAIIVGICFVLMAMFMVGTVKILFQLNIWDLFAHSSFH